ncbi:unnamed protein product [Echinostoma caproni]|uniref:RRM domain-containing protein n=1 Tax=Echinostoma caproni TaxID=27848 RepID=A0A3P8GYQ1_9TREM|nr:unnamed protein product [Echinostoma caproni]
MPTSGQKVSAKRKKNPCDQDSGVKRCKIKGEQATVVAQRDNGGKETANIEETDDLKVLEEIIKRIKHRNECTVRISGLPLRCDPSSLSDLAPEAKAYRVPWNPHIHGSEGIAFLEFGSKALAVSCQLKLNQSQFLNKTIVAEIGRFLSEDIATYDCKKLAVYGLHYKTRTAELARRFPSATAIQLRPLRRRSDRRKPELAFLTFSTVEDALKAFDSRQGCIIRKRKLSLLWARAKLSEKNDSLERNKYLLVSGIKSSVSEADIQSVFPQASSVKINRLTGEAWLKYDLEEDCILDHQNARGVMLKGRKLKVFMRKTKTHTKSLETATEYGSSLEDKSKFPDRK